MSYIYIYIYIYIYDISRLRVNDAVNFEDYILLNDWMIEVLHMHLPGGKVHNYDPLGPRAEFCSHDLFIQVGSASH